MSDLFYNRNRNVTGVTPITGLTFNPKQGSSVTFTTRVFENIFPNKVKSRLGQSLNSVMAEYNLMFGLRETEAAQVIDYFESRSGVLPINLNDASEIYKPISGFADEFSWATSANNMFEVTSKVVIDNRSPKLNWSGLAFLNFQARPWRVGESIEKYDIRYFERDASNKFNNYFYATGEHSSAVANCPLSTGSFWSQDLFFEQDVNFNVSTAPSVSKVEFSNSFPIRLLDKKNIHLIENLNVSFVNVPKQKAMALLHFAESKFGELKFVYECPKLYRPKVFYCPQWKHTWNYEGSHNIEFNLVEDPLGVLSRDESPIVEINQSTGWSNIYFDTFSSNSVSIVSFDGGDETVLANGTTVKNWDSAMGHRVELFGSVTGVSCANQRLDSVSIGENSRVRRADFSNSFVSNVELNGCRNLQEVDLSYNSLGSLDLGGLTGLKSLDIRSNRIVDLDITDCVNLTGLSASGNRFSSSQISTHLDAFVNFGRYSGSYDVRDGYFPDFPNNEKLSGQGFTDAAILGWRKWSLSFDNARIPLNPSNYATTTSHFKQESITGINDGQSIFVWDDSIGNVDASRFSVPDSSRPQYVAAAIGQRSSLQFNGESFLAQTGIRNLPTTHGIFAVVKPESSGRMTVFSDSFNRGMLISGNTLVSKANLTNNFFGELSGNSYNVVGFYSDGTGIWGAVNSQTPTIQSKSANTLSLPGAIGMTFEGTTGNSNDFPFIGGISEIIVTSSVTDFAAMMRDLGAKHGLEII